MNNKKKLGLLQVCRHKQARSTQTGMMSGFKISDIDALYATNEHGSRLQLFRNEASFYLGALVEACVEQRVLEATAQLEVSVKQEFAEMERVKAEQRAADETLQAKQQAKEGPDKQAMQMRDTELTARETKLDNRAKALDARAAQYKVSLAQVVSQTGKYKTMLAEVEAQADELKTKKAAYKENLAQVEALADELKTHNAAYKENLAKEEALADELKTRNAAYKENLAKVEALADELKTKKADVELRVAACNEALTEVDAREEQIKQIKTRVVATKQEKQTKHAKCTTASPSTNEKLDVLESALENLEITLMSAVCGAQMLDAEKYRLQYDLADKTGMITGLSDFATSKMVELRQLESENVNMRLSLLQNEGILQVLAERTGRVEDLTKEVAQLRLEVSVLQGGAVRTNALLGVLQALVRARDLEETWNVLTDNDMGTLEKYEDMLRRLQMDTDERLVALREEYEKMYAASMGQISDILKHKQSAHKKKITELSVQIQRRSTANDLCESEVCETKQRLYSSQLRLHILERRLKAAKQTASKLAT